MNTTIKKYCQRLGLTVLALSASAGTGWAQNITVNAFDTSAEVSGYSYQNWNGSPTGTESFSSNQSTISGSPTSGSMQISVVYGGAGQNGGSFVGSGPTLDLSQATGIEFDAMIDPSSPLDNLTNAMEIKMGFNAPSYNAPVDQWIGLNYAPMTLGVWHHFSVVFAPGTLKSNSGQFFMQCMNYSYNNVAYTPIVYIDNIVVDVPPVGGPTYPSITALTFDNVTNVVTTGTTGWYGDPINTYEWSSLDASNNPNSGSLHIVADFTAGDNSCVCAIPFDPLYPGFSSPTPDTNVVINAQQMASVEMDIKWDTANSTVGIDGFNSVGDINGFPVGLLYNVTGAGSGGQAEACGSTTTSLPDAASNGWVHVSFPINPATAGIDQCIGLWLKKYQPNTALSGTVAFYIDNVHFTGGLIPQTGPPITISKPVYGLQQVHSTGGYKREGVVTANSTFSFVNQPNTTYSMNIAYFPPDAGMSANFMFVPLQAPSVDGTAAEPNWTYPNILCAIIQPNGTNSTLTLAAKINQPNDNGSLYNNPANLVSGDTDMSFHPVFTTASPITGNWTLKFTANNAITVTAPDGSSTNVIFPGVYLIDTNGLSSSEVTANFDFGLGMVVYFNSQNGGAATAGRVVLGSATISRGATTLLTDNFATDTTLDTTSTWILASDGGATLGTYILAHSIQWYLEWPITFNGFNVQTNSILTASSAWNTNAITPISLGTVYHANVDSTNLPPSGNVFFRAVH